MTDVAREEEVVAPGTVRGNEPDLEDDVISYLAGCGYADLPPATITHTKKLVLDALGAAIAGSDAEGCRALAELVGSWGGNPEATVIGSEARVPAHNAALVNATIMRALEIDDAHERALLHATATMVPVALAMSEARRDNKVDGREFLAVVTAGIDLASRLSLAPNYSVAGDEHRPRGMSYTYQCGILVGSLVAGRLMGLDTAGLRNALGLGYSHCSGNQQGLVEGVLAVRVQQGLTAHGSVIAAELAASGITGARHSLEGRFGYYNTFHQGDYDRTVILNGLGERFESDEVSIKPYPCCKATHTAIAAMFNALDSRPVDPERIRKVVIHVNNKEYFDVVCPAEKRDRANLAGARGSAVAQFRMPFVVACAIVRRRVSLAEFSAASRSDPEILSMMDRVETVIDPNDYQAIGRLLPSPSEVEIFLDDGSPPIRGYAQYAKGHPRDPMSFQEVAAKFAALSSGPGRLSAAGAERVVSFVDSIESKSDVTQLMPLLVFTDPRDTGIKSRP
jgi:2-methylcitrate dehydratase PrpD